MKRTQIYIDEDTFGFLEKESKIEKKSISEIIRESIKVKMKNRNNEIIKKMKSVYGVQQDKKVNGDECVRKMRKDRIL